MKTSIQHLWIPHRNCLQSLLLTILRKYYNVYQQRFNLPILNNGEVTCLNKKRETQGGLINTEAEVRVKKGDNKS